jgi:hypothetical protein
MTTFCISVSNYTKVNSCVHITGCSQLILYSSIHQLLSFTAMSCCIRLKSLLVYVIIVSYYGHNSLLILTRFRQYTLWMITVPNLIFSAEKNVSNDIDSKMTFIWSTVVMNILKCTAILQGSIVYFDSFFNSQNLCFRYRADEPLI